MLRFMVSLLCLGSCALCAVIVTLWIRSCHQHDAFSHVLHGNRYTLTSSSGTIELFAPPAPARDAQQRMAAERLVSQLDDDQVCWVGEYWLDADTRELSCEIDAAEPRCTSAAERLEKEIAPGDAARPLLSALEDPGRFVIAHLLLARQMPTWNKRFAPCRPIPGRYLGECRADLGSGEHWIAPWMEVDLAGVPVTLCRWREKEGVQVSPGYTSLGQWIHELDGDADAARFPAVRAEWHRRLDVRAAAVAHWQAAAFTALLPLWSIGRGIRKQLTRRRRRKSGCCPACGYDLRATIGRCPECGRATGEEVAERRGGGVAM
jgi:hypothetical protein